MHDAYVIEEAERLCPAAYPLYVDPAALKPHEEVLEERSYAVVHPIAADYKTAVVLDGRHGLRLLRRAGLFQPKTTWHTYRGRHVSQIPTAPALEARS
jgi:hypothetical protein